MISQVRIRAFRAIDDPETSSKFVKEHRSILEIFGVSNISSNTADWVQNPSVFVIVTESIDRQEIYGGVRIHVAEDGHPLPIEKAIAEQDPGIHAVVRKYAPFGLGEVCALWNSKKTASAGVGSLLLLRAAIAITSSIKLTTLISLCSPVIVPVSQSMSCCVLTTVGKDGQFNYPRADIISTVILLEDAIGLKDARPKERKRIFCLRKTPQINAHALSPLTNELINLHYELALPKANTRKFPSPSTA